MPLSFTFCLRLARNQNSNFFASWEKPFISIILRKIIALPDSIKPAGLSVLILVPLAKTKFRRYQTVFLSKIMRYFFLKDAGIYGTSWVLLNRRRLRNVHANYVICKIVRKTLMAKRKIYENTNDGPLTRPQFEFVRIHCVELQSSQNLGSSQVLLKN